VVPATTPRPEAAASVMPVERDLSQEDFQDIQREIDEVKQTIDALDKYEEHLQQQQQDSAEEMYLQRREERRVKKHVSFDLSPEVVHEYGESAETTEVEEMTDEEGQFRQEQRESREELFEIGECGGAGVCMCVCVARVCDRDQIRLLEIGGVCWAIDVFFGGVCSLLFSLTREINYMFRISSLRYTKWYPYLV
jgi:hypothetical protein